MQFSAFAPGHWLMNAKSANRNVCPCTAMNFPDLVNRIRTERGLTSDDVPGFDPNNGNEGAKYLFLLEAPGPIAKKTGEISLKNKDPSARNLREQLRVAGIGHKDLALWNVVPWYLSNDPGTSIRAATASDVREGIEYLVELIEAMPNLRCIVLVGGAARQAHMFLSRKTTARIVTCHHTSARATNSNRDAARENIEVFSYVKATT